MSRDRKRKPHRRAGNAETRWTADDALREYAKLIRWYDSPDGVREAYHTYNLFHGGRWSASLPDEADRQAMAEHTARVTAESMRGLDPIWCDPPMVDLLAAAADSYPDEPMHPEHLIAPDGMAIFAKSLPAIWRDDDGTVEHRLAAISWGRKRLAPWIEPEHVGGPASPHRLLQALSALIRTPLVRDENTPPSKAALRDAERAGLRDSAVRRVHLRRPEHAEHELQAVRDARRDRPSRGHWVRGHWKKQWYPSIEEHRPVWITGYPRGDFATGVVPGTKVLIATERKLAEPSDTTP